MNIAEFKEGLQTKILGNTVTHFERIDSTNTQAKVHCEAHDTQEGSIFVADKQDQGKGTDGNRWTSGEGNLSLSIVFRYDEKVNTLFPLYPAVALAKVLRQNYQIDAHVKWPNDVLIGNKKISGILCEGSPNKYMIVGIGINVNQDAFSKEIKDIAISMKSITGETFSISTLCQHFLLEYENLLYGTANIHQEWIEHTEMIGKSIAISQNGNKSNVKIIGLSQEGFLQIENADGSTENLMARSGLDIDTNY